GIDIKYVKQETLESTVVKGLYFAGEILDVCGKRGGYNLAWAWGSGFTAGRTL
ncbi:MAG: NAD(P)/FAD-dependent oxidoreductase, partial [Candidatus Omnitrophota bacterium]